MTSYNTKYMINEYVTDFGITIKNLGIKIQTKAPYLNDLYQTRKGGLCGGGLDFKPRRIEAVFEDGRKLIYPVPKISDIKGFAEKLQPGLLANAIPGNSADEAICLNLVGEEWGMIPFSVGEPKQEALIDVVEGSIKKEAVNYEYNSDIAQIGKIRLSFQLQKNWVESIIKCQKEGMVDVKTSTSICVTTSGISPRKLIMSTGYKNTEAFRGRSIGSREVPLSNRDDASTVAKAIAECSRCIGYKGESVPNLQLYIGGGTL